MKKLLLVALVAAAFCGTDAQAWWGRRDKTSCTDGNCGSCRGKRCKSCGVRRKCGRGGCAPVCASGTCGDTVRPDYVGDIEGAELGEKE